MSGTESIFQKRRLSPGQFHAIAELRYDDAICLLDSGENARANGAMYLGGFVIECMLKARLLSLHPNLQNAIDPAALSTQDRRILSLLFSHDLEGLLDNLPEIERRLKQKRDSSGQRLLLALRAICGQWTIYARYSTRVEKISVARKFMSDIGEVKPWLKTL